VCLPPSIPRNMKSTSQPGRSGKSNTIARANRRVIGQENWPAALPDKENHPNIQPHRFLFSLAAHINLEEHFCAKLVAAHGSPLRAGGPSQVSSCRASGHLDPSHQIIDLSASRLIPVRVFWVTGLVGQGARGLGVKGWYLIGSAATQSSIEGLFQNRGQGVVARSGSGKPFFRSLPRSSPPLGPDRWGSSVHTRKIIGL